MEVKWKKLIFLVSVWLILEIFLNQLGLDTIVDYSEFIFEKEPKAIAVKVKRIVQGNTIQLLLVANVPDSAEVMSRIPDHPKMKGDRN